MRDSIRDRDRDRETGKWIIVETKIRTAVIQKNKVSNISQHQLFKQEAD